MSNNLSAKKRVRENKVIRLHNRQIRSTTRSKIKDFEKALEDKDNEKALVLLKESQKALDSAASKGAFNKKAVSRKKSRLAISYNKAIAGSN